MQLTHTNKNRWKWLCTGILILSVLCMASCGDQHDAYKNAVYIYMCGSTLETSRGCATDNLAELLSAQIPEDTCIVVQTGGARRWRDYDISNEHLTRFALTSNGMRQLVQVEQASMGNPETLEEFLTFCAKRYPAEHTGLIFWDHGGGSVAGVCFDENYNMDGLTIQEFSEVIGHVVNTNQKKYDFIGFDACLMASYETAEAIWKYADYMLASQELEPLGGWNYKVLAETFGIDGFYGAMLDGYAQKCRDSQTEVYTLSCFDLSRFETVQTIFNQFALHLDTLAEQSMEQFAAVSEQVLSFGYHSEVEGYSNMVDLSGFADALGYSRLTEAIRATTVRVGSQQLETAGGLSLFFPLDGGKQINSYLTNGKNENYNRFLAKNYTNIPETSLIEFSDSGSEINGELHVSVTADSGNYIKGVEYKLFQIINLNDEEQTALCFGTDTDIDIDGTNYTVSFGGKWVTWNGIYIYVTAIERLGDLTVFTTPVHLNGQRGSIRFVYDIAKRTYSIQGFLPEVNQGAVSRLCKLEEGDEITLLYQQISPEYEEVWCIGESFTYRSDDNLCTSDVPEGRYLISFRICDVFGNVYRSNTELVQWENGKLVCLEILDDIRNLKFRPVNERQ